jgi:hypothetical protein
MAPAAPLTIPLLNRKSQCVAPCMMVWVAPRTYSCDCALQLARSSKTLWVKSTTTSLSASGANQTNLRDYERLARGRRGLDLPSAE